ncbi:hypothetical protein vBBceHLY2_00072 [Bacillus phage vB_BceH_LY2]|nr:hypothetical protein vBBceHLY2_00072 [Bacillus phage vB_BceH_LY2]
MTKHTSKRSVARGHDSRNSHNKSVVDNGKNAIENRKRSKSGTYTPSFIETYEKVTEKDVDLRKSYAIDLTSKHLGVRRELIKLDDKRSSIVNTLTSRDEVWYVYIGNQVVGKLSVRTQRTYKGISLVFILQTKQVINQTSNGAFSKSNKKAKSKGQITSDKRKTYNKARGK